jgi:hypothetical protein
MLLDPRNRHCAIVGHESWSTWDALRYWARFFVLGCAITIIVALWLFK